MSGLVQAEEAVVAGRNAGGLEARGTHRYVLRPLSSVLIRVRYVQVAYLHPTGARRTK